MSAFKNKWSRLLCGLLITLLSGMPTLVTAQSVTGTISGTVADSSGAVISGATITLINERTGETRKLTANDDGRFVFSAIQPDIYTIKIEVQGFQALEKKNITLSANENLALGNLELSPGQVTETVTVTTEGERVETESSDLTARLTSDQIDLISTKGRDITSLLRLLPGVSYIDDIEAVGEGFGTDLPNISGQRGRSTVATVDGLNASEPSGSNKISMTTNQDAIAEVKVLRNNYSAEYGNNGGAQINIVVKSGKKDYAGSAYYFIRNEALNANRFFNNRQGLPRPLYRHNIWGFNFGGPVKVPWLFPNKERKNLFFFYSFEKPHTITPTSAKFVTVPTERERRGDFSQTFESSGRLRLIRDPLLQGTCGYDTAGKPILTACFPGNIIPASRLHPGGLAILNAFVLPNQSVRRDGNTFNYVVQRSVDVPKQSQVIRVDFKPTNKDSFYVKAQTWTSDNEGFDTSGWPGGDNNRWGINSHYLYQDDGLVVNWVHVFSPRIVNEINIGARHGSEGFIPGDGEIERFSRARLNYTSAQLFPGNNRLGLIPRATNWGGLSQTTAANINWLDRWGEIGQDYILPSISDNLTINRGNHNYKAGMYLERIRNGEAPGGNWSGTFNFRSDDGNYTAALGNTGHPYANAALGNFRSYSEASSRPHTDLERLLIQWYVQDQWKVNRRFTANYGLRMGWYSQWRQRQDDASNFDPTRFDPKKAVVLYRPFCVGGTPATAACANANRRALNPVTGQLSTNLDLVGTFVPGVGDPLNGIVLGTDPTVPKGFKEQAPIQWEPRVGFAWAVFDKTVLRLQGGVYHTTRSGGGTTGGNLVSNPPFQRNVTIDFGNIDNLANLVSTALLRPVGLNAVERHAKTPTIYNFSLGIQQEIGFKSILEVSYVGSLGRHLGESRNINFVPFGARFLDLHPENRNPFSTVNATFNSGALADNFLRRYQGYGNINMVMYSGSSNYNGLQVQLNRRYTRGLQFGIAYTWAKTLDYIGDDADDLPDGLPYKTFNYGPANHDQNHIFTANYIWDIPRLGNVWDNRVIRGIFDGWQLSGTTSLVSGRPATPSVSYSPGFDFTGGATNARPILVCDPNKRNKVIDRRDPQDGTPVLIDTSCYRRPTARGEIGNFPRNHLRLPGIFNSDLALFKKFSLGEKRTLQFRWETYNIFNHTNFSGLDTGMTFNAEGVQTDRRFGQPTGSRSARVMQGSLRISF